MLQAPITQSYQAFSEKNSDDIIKNINKEIKKTRNANMTVDISGLNVIEASKVAALCSTFHYLTHTDGVINWLVNSKNIERLSKPLSLGNSRFTVV